MPSGQRHLKLEMILWPVFCASFYYVDRELTQVLAFALAYLSSSLLLTPDLDLRHNSARRRWGVLGFIWIPYSTVFKHRGMSHNLLFGMATRVAYLALIGALGAAGAAYAGLIDWPETYGALNWPLVASVGAGLYVPNVLHVLYDHWDTSRKLRRNRRLRAR